MRKTILELQSGEARRYFMEAENYCSLSLPSYIKFQPMLDYVQNKVGKQSYENCLSGKNSHPSKFDKVNYKLLINKDGKYQYRPIQITNPYLYYLLVRTITEEKHWQRLQSRFREFKSEKIEVSSIPHVRDTIDRTTTATNIMNWWEKLEQRTVELSLDYKYMFMTDITNCYGSIYSHSIDWAISGKEQAKDANTKGKNKGQLGHIIDTYIQGMQYGQTNGIPQGGAIFDFIAEIVLGFADMLLAQALIKLKNYRLSYFEI